MTCTVAHQVVVGALLGVQRPDHTVEGAPASQGATAVEYRGVQIGLHTATPEQQGVVVFQPVVVAQAGGDGLDLLGFADDEQEAGFVTPEVAVAFAQLNVDTTPDRFVAVWPWSKNTELLLYSRVELQCGELPERQHDKAFKQQNHQACRQQPYHECHPLGCCSYPKNRVIHPDQ
ncbi:hypothetical protein D3C85_887420 [compost metagenome]